MLSKKGNVYDWAQLTKKRYEERTNYYNMYNTTEGYKNYTTI